MTKRSHSRARCLPPGPVPGRYWKIDLAKLALEELQAGSVSAHIELSGEAKRKGVVATDLGSAGPQHDAIISAAEGNAVDWRSGRFTALNAARREGGVFIFLPKGVVIDEPIVVTLRLEGPAAFPYVLVAASEGARATLVTRYDAAANLELVSEIVEIIALEHAAVTYAAIQDLPPNVRTFWSRHGNVGRDAELNWAIGELGAELSIGDVKSTTLEAGARTTIAGFFFPNKRQHVDVQSEADHPARHKHNPKRYSRALRSTAVRRVTSATFASIPRRTASMRRCATTHFCSPKIHTSIVSRRSRSGPTTSRPITARRSAQSTTTSSSMR